MLLGWTGDGVVTEPVNVASAEVEVAADAAMLELGGVLVLEAAAVDALTHFQLRKLVGLFVKPSAMKFELPGSLNSSGTAPLQLSVLQHRPLAPTFRSSAKSSDTSTYI